MAYEYWQEELKLLAPATRQVYVHYFNAFISWLGVSPEELYQWQKRLIENGDKRNNREIVHKFVEYYRFRIANEGLQGSTILKMNVAVQSFLAANSLEWPIRPRDLPPSNPVGARVILLDEIKQLWDLVSNENKLRNRAILMMLKDSGLRRGDVVKMNIEDYLGSRVIETENGDFRVFSSYKTDKTGEIAFLHLGPETVEAVDKYLKLDGRTGGALFLDRKNKRLGAGSITMFIDRLANYIDNGDKLSPHSFRKTHRTLLEARIPESYVKKLRGKSTDTYIRPEETGELTRAYIQNYDALRVFREEQELDAVKQELQQYKSNTNSQQYEIEAMRAKLERMEQMFVEVFDNPAALEETKRRLTKQKKSRNYSTLMGHCNSHLME